jgi:hypothetical protein
MENGDGDGAGPEPNSGNLKFTGLTHNFPVDPAV